MGGGDFYSEGLRGAREGGWGLKFHCALHTLNPSLLSFPFHFMVVKMNMHTYIQTPKSSPVRSLVLQRLQHDVLI